MTSNERFFWVCKPGSHAPFSMLHDVAQNRVGVSSGSDNWTAPLSLTTVRWLRLLKYKPYLKKIPRIEE